MRDYCKDIILAIESKYPNSFTDTEKTLLIPPYNKEGDNKSGRVVKSDKYSRVESPFRMDFENYTIGRLVPGRGNYDYEHEEYIEIKEKILWRINELGWNPEKYKKIEGYIESDHGYHRMHKAKVERYGKKYSWIAYYEMAGYLTDNNRLDNEDYRFTTDIDPCFPASLNIHDLNGSDYLNELNSNTNEWITSSPIPNLEDIISKSTLEDAEGPWTLIYGHISEESKSLNRNFYTSSKVILIERKEKETLIDYWKNKKNSTDRIDIEQSYYFFAGEMNNPIGKAPPSNISFDIQVGEKTEKQRRTIVDQDSNEEGGFTLTFREGEEEDVQVPIIEKINAISPVGNYSYSPDNTSLKATSFYVLTNDLVKSLGLYLDVETIDYYDCNNKLAAKNLEYKGYGYSNSRELFYIRSDLLDKYCEDNNLELLWVIHGERRYANYDDFEGPGNESLERYKDFSFVLDSRGELLFEEE